MSCSKLVLARFAALFCVVSFISSVLAQEEEGENQQGGKAGIVAYASSSTRTSAPGFAVDSAGAVTAWRTDGAMPQWIAVDLGDRVKLDRIRWRKEPMPGAPRDFDIQLTNNDEKHDGKAMWRTVAKVKGNTDRCGGVVTFPATRAQCIRIYVHEPLPSLDKDAPSRLAIGDIQAGFVDPLMTPQGLVAEAAGDTVKLSWQPPPTAADKIAGYNICRATNPDDGYRVVNVNGLRKEPDYVDDHVLSGTTYHYKVSAVTSDGGWEGDLSREATVTAAKFDCAPLGKERPGVSRYALGRFGMTDYLGHYSVTEGLMAFSFVMEYNRQFYLMWPTRQKGAYGIRGLEKAGFPYSPKPLAFGTVRPTDAGRGEKPVVRILSSSWVGMQIEMKYKSTRMVVYESLLSPAIAIDVEGKGVGLFDEMKVFGIGGPHGMGYLYGGKAESGILSKSRLVTPKMGIPWLLVWFGGGKGWEEVDVPWLVTFQNRPDVIRWNGQFIDISFPEKCGFITMAPLYGMEKLIDTAEWQQSLPPAVARKCSNWVPHFHTMPIECAESFALDAEANRVKIRQQYKFLNIEDAWETRHVRFSPMPPVVALAMRSGYPVKTNYETRSMQYDTTFGPLHAAIDTDIIEWEIPAPLDVVANARKPAKEDVRDPELAKTIRSLFSEKRLSCPAGYAAIPAADELRKKGRGRGEAAFQPFEGNYRMWGALEDSAKMKFASGAAMLLKNIGAFDIGSLRLVTDSLSGKRGYVDSWLPDGLDARPMQARNAAEILKGIWAYGFHFDKLDEIRGHWETILAHFDLLRTTSDWAMQTPLSSMEAGVPRRGSSVNLDLDETLTIYEGLIATARMAKAVGDMRTYEEAVYMAAKAQVLIFAFHKYEDYAAGLTPWQALDGSTPDPGHAYVPTLSGSAGAGSWVARPGKGYALSPEAACFYNSYLRNDIARRFYRSAFVPEGMRDDEKAPPMQGPHALSAENLLVRALLFESDPKKLWTWTRNVAADGRANDLSVYGSVAVRSLPFDGSPPGPAWEGKEVEDGLLKEVAEVPFDQAIENAKKAASGAEIWKIGETDGKGDDFGKDAPTPPADKNDAVVFRAGSDKAGSWPAKHPARVCSDKGPPLGRKVYYMIQFDLVGQPKEGKYLIVVGLQKMPSDFPLYYQAELNDATVGVHCREAVGGDDQPVQFALDIDGKSLKSSGNTLTLSIGGGCESVEYDSIRCVYVGQ